MLAPFQPGIIPGCCVSRRAFSEKLKSGVQLCRFSEEHGRVYAGILRELRCALDRGILQ
jgi:hypothetical protein